MGSHGDELNFANPIAVELEDDRVTAAPPLLMDWDDAMLQDLVFAFEACDVDGNGLLDAEELRAVIRVLSGVSNDDLTLDTVVSLIHEVLTARPRAR